MSFLIPTLAIHLEEFDIDTMMVGVFFAIPCVFYIFGALMIPQFLKCIGRRGLIWLGAILEILSLFMIGTSRLINIPNESKFIFMGQCMQGLATALIVIPMLPEMLDRIYAKYPMLVSTPIVNDMTAGYFNSCLGMGEALGPLLSSVLLAKGDFRSACDILAISMGVYMLLFFIINGGCQIFKLTPIDEVKKLLSERSQEGSYSNEFERMAELGDALMEANINSSGVKSTGRKESEPRQ